MAVMTVKMAKERGKQAYLDGRMAASALDPGFLEACRNRPRGVEVIELLTAWASGWHTANAKGIDQKMVKEAKESARKAALNV